MTDYEQQLDQVLDYAIERHRQLVANAREGDRKFGRSGYTPPDIETFLIKSDPSGTLIAHYRARRDRERLN